MAALTEFELIDRFFRRPESSADSARGIVLGIGDDAALLAPTPGNELAASVDMLVSGRHFFADVDSEALGHKALAVNLSDMASMGATPRWALLAGALPDADAQWLKGFARGFFALAKAHAVDLCRRQRIERVVRARVVVRVVAVSAVFEKLECRQWAYGVAARFVAKELDGLLQTETSGYSNSTYAAPRAAAPR